ncbi:MULTISPECIES: helix-turn-helix transcriptional regulator [unclassified Variovorax]|uniref:helix-turn-helix domain-containing protein n=1 Tax=unclassified Variovorax TaxID=663243 RepID=UPI002578648F|nr:MULTISPECIES: helix-turn-helix transcriptional regulator [unclassified Variovorax]MDM0087231.1 helix-turn-helix transcriptional regulator [Variovorax sp. J22G40]MDM0144512.1 helix-turn-helix transcriptional regulator [Variovorax sp. J2P1-31]
MNAYFPGNLKLLCSHYRSIADVCRRLEINRAQFNKYLSGQSVPTAHNLKRICDFFGVDELEIAQPAPAFAQLIGVRRDGGAAAQPKSPPLAHLEHLRAQSSESRLARHVGYYFEYYHSMSSPGHILRSLVHLRADAGHFGYERTERLQRADAPADHVRCRYIGTTFDLQGKLFLVDYESLTSNEISQTVLTPSFKNRVTRLNGLKLGVASNDQRAPCCSRVVWDYLGTEIRRVSCYRQLGLFAPDDPAIGADIREQLQAVKLEQGLFQLR